MIGTLAEKTLHAELKNYFEPDQTRHEIPVGSYIADIVNENGIFEIQTRSFVKLRNKLSEFLEISPVTVIYPLPKTKWLVWVDENTGEATRKRKSPKQGGIHAAFPELYWIKQFLSHPNFRLIIVMADLEEYRYLNGWSENRKRGSTRYDRLPVQIAEVLYFRDACDYLRFIPDELCDGFTSRDYKEAARVSQSTAQTALNILHSLGTINRVGKQGNMYIYERADGIISRAEHKNKGQENVHI